MINRTLLFGILLIFSFIRSAYFLNVTNPTKNESESIHHWSKRETNKQHDHDEYKANQTSRVIKLALVLNNKLSEMNKVTEKYHQEIVTELNSLFQQFNVSVTLVNTIILTVPDDNWILNKNITITYNNFQKYVEKLNRTNIDHFQLMVAKELDESINLIPQSKTNKMCGISVGVNRNNAFNQTQVARSIARVLAHSLGLDEDGVNNGCSSNDWRIMAKLKHTGSENWSTCSINALKQIFMNKTQFTCLNNPSFDEPRCGNGVLDKEEKCDCGSKCVNSYCNTTTCQFSINNVCSLQKCDIVKPKCADGVEPICFHVEKYPAVCNSSGQCTCLNNETSSKCSCPDSHPEKHHNLALSGFAQWRTYFYILLAVLLILLIVAISFSCIICYMKRLRLSSESQPKEESNAYAEVAYNLDDAGYASTSIAYFDQHSGMHFQRSESPLPLSPVPELGSECYDRPYSAYSGSHIYAEPIHTD